MADIVGDAHVEEQRLVLHYMAVLGPAESDLIHAHLQRCESCRTTADEIIETLGSLALLIGADDAKARAVVTAKAVPEGSTAGASPAAPAGGAA